jgi:hypothetical protein
MRRCNFSWILGGLAWGLLGLAAEARAHFLFVRIGPLAEAGRPAEVFFSELAEAGDPRYVDRFVGAALFAQSAARPGVWTEMPVAKASDRLRAAAPATGSIGVVGVCEYGVLARPNQTPFLLRYYPKAVAGIPDELNGLKPVNGSPAPGAKPVALEIVPTFENHRVRLVALRAGKPIPGLKFTTVDSDLSNSEFNAGQDGQAVWSPPKPGRYSVYVRDDVKTPGESQGVHYDEIREFATLAFTWPLDRRDADAEAVALFEKAVAARAAWNDFPGFSADLEGTLEGRPFAGTVTVSAEGEVEVQVDDDAAKGWLEDQLGSIVMHRLPEPPGDSSTKPVLRFADGEEDHPMGRLLTFQGGRFASSYRVRDGQITVVNRNMGKRNMTISVLHNTPTPEGKFLPHSYLVQYWDAATGALDRVETIQERWSRVGKLDLPTEHTVGTTSSAGLSVRSVTLSGHKLK